MKSYLPFLVTVVVFFSCKTSDGGCKQFFVYDTKKVNIKGISAKLKAEGVPIDASVGEISVDPKFVEVSDKLKQLDLLQFSLCSQINELSKIDTASTREIRLKYINTLQSMMLIAQKRDTISVHIQTVNGDVIKGDKVVNSVNSK